MSLIMPKFDTLSDYTVSLSDFHDDYIKTYGYPATRDPQSDVDYSSGDESSDDDSDGEVYSELEEEQTRRTFFRQNKIDKEVVDDADDIENGYEADEDEDEFDEDGCHNFFKHVGFEDDVEPIEIDENNDNNNDKNDNEHIVIKQGIKRAREDNDYVYGDEKRRKGK